MIKKTFQFFKKPLLPKLLVRLPTYFIMIDKLRTCNAVKIKVEDKKNALDQWQ